MKLEYIVPGVLLVGVFVLGNALYRYLTQRLTWDDGEPATLALLVSVGSAAVTPWICEILVRMVTDPVILLVIIPILFVAIPFTAFVTLMLSLPIFLLVWLPLWANRNRLAHFWQWHVAPIVGGALGLVFIVLVTGGKIRLSNRGGHGGEWSAGLTVGIYVGAIVGIALMFAIGTYWLHGKPSFAVRPLPIASDAEPYRRSVLREWFLTTLGTSLLGGIVVALYVVVTNPKGPMRALLEFPSLVLIPAPILFVANACIVLPIYLTIGLYPRAWRSGIVYAIGITSGILVFMYVVHQSPREFQNQSVWWPIVIGTGLGTLGSLVADWTHERCD